MHKPLIIEGQALNKAVQWKIDTDFNHFRMRNVVHINRRMADIELKVIIPALIGMFRINSDEPRA